MAIDSLEGLSHRLSSHKEQAMAVYTGVPTEVRNVTFEEFLAQCDEDTWAEWVNGEIIMMTPASNRHQNLSDFLLVLMRSFVERHHLGIVRSAPFLMRLSEDTAREPDILFVANEHLDRLKETYLDGPADLVVEIVSPESRLRDRGEKFAEYEMAGIPEYWLIDPDLKRADFYVLGEDERYERLAADAKGVYRSRVLRGFWLNVNWLWQEPLPPVLEILQELGLISAL